MSKVIVSKVNDVFMKVDCDDGLARDLYDFFSFTVPGAKFMPSVKNRYWDGKVRLFSLKTKRIYIGLLPYVDEFCRERGFDFDGISDVIGEKTDIKFDLKKYFMTPRIAGCFSVWGIKNRQFMDGGEGIPDYLVIWRKNSAGVWKLKE